MATIESLTERVLLLETVTQQYRVTLRTLEEQQTLQMRSHETLHQEFRNMGSRSDGAGRFANRIDKTLLPSKYTGEKERWRMFSSKFVSCLAKVYPDLKPAMEAEMGKSQPLKPKG